MYLFALLRPLAPALRSLGALLTRAYLAWERHRRARAYYRTLHELDDRTLRDLGFDRSELSSVAAELIGDADATRAHTQRSEGVAQVTSKTVKAPLYLRDRSA